MLTRMRVAGLAIALVAAGSLAAGLGAAGRREAVGEDTRASGADTAFGWSLLARPGAAVGRTGGLAAPDAAGLASTLSLPGLLGDVAGRATRPAAVGAAGLSFKAAASPAARLPAATSAMARPATPIRVSTVVRPPSA